MTLDTTIDEGELGHILHHETLAERFNNGEEILSDTFANRPDATTVEAGTLFWATDTNVLYRSDGATWSSLSAGTIDHGTLTGLGDDDHPQYTTAAEVATEIGDHEAAADPHTGYRLESADHTHQSTGLQAGQLDHGLALTGLTDDDHTIYAINIPVTFAKQGELEVTTDTGAHRFYVEGNFTIAHVQISVAVAPTGSSVIVDVNVDGTTIFTTQSNRPEIAVSGFFDASGTINDPDHDDGQYITVNIDQIGSTLPGEGLTVIVWIKRR